MYKVVLIQKEYVNPRIIPIETKDGIVLTKFEAGVVYLQCASGSYAINNHLRCLEHIATKNKQTEDSRERNQWYSCRELNVDDLFNTPSLTDTIILPPIDKQSGYETTWLRNHLDLIYNMLNEYPEFFEV